MTLQELIKWYEEDYKYHRLHLAERMKNLATNLNKKADYLAENEDATVASTGEIQSQGTIIDAYCGRLSEKYNNIKKLKDLV